MVPSSHAREIALMLAAIGGTVTISVPKDMPNDDEWESESVFLGDCYEATGVVVAYEQQFIDDANILRGDQRAYISTHELATDIHEGCLIYESAEEEINNDSVPLQIIAIKEYRINNQIICYRCQVRGLK
jgi:hypothetical protein